MSTFECPHCHAEHYIGDYPDHLSGMRNNRFTFECECGSTFECSVDWEPLIWVSEESLVPPKPDPARAALGGENER